MNVVLNRTDLVDSVSVNSWGWGGGGGGAPQQASNPLIVRKITQNIESEYPV